MTSIDGVGVRVVNLERGNGRRDTVDALLNVRMLLSGAFAQRPR